MTPKTIGFLAVLAGAFLIYWMIDSSVVSSREHVQQTYSQIQNQMQRQADLLPNLAETVKGYAGHESKTLTAVIEARNQALAIARMDPAKLASDPDSQKKMLAAMTAGNQAMLAINQIREAYPDLKAAALFISLMSQIEGSQNRISVARRDNLRAIQDYNASIQYFPTFIAANMRGYTTYPYFTATDAAQSGPPQIKF